jgi:DNA-binding transcriptional ArsR family regulator
MQDQLEHLRALADESRLDIMLFLLHTGGKDGQPLSYTVSEIAERFKISMSTVSHHLQELKRVGIVRMERHGKERVYQADLDYMISQVEAIHKRLIQKREMIRQGIPGCPTELLVEFLTKNKPVGSTEATN